MGEVGKISFEGNVKELAEAVQKLSEQIQGLRQDNSAEAETLEKFKEDGTPLEFILVTSGFIRGKILWVGDHSLSLETDSGQNVILYKQAIAFVQEQTEE